MEKKIVFYILIALFIGLLIANVTNGKTREEKIRDYNVCVSSEMTKYYAKIRPAIDICMRENDPVCARVINEGIEKQKTEVRKVCSIHLD